MMPEENVIGDVRTAKSWVDARYPTFDELAKRLSEIEQSYASRSGEFALVPTLRSAEASDAVANAASEPGHALLNDARSSRAS